MTTPSGWLRAVLATTEAGGGCLVGACTDHIIVLRSDAVALHQRESYGSATLLTTTAIEEVAKAHIGIFRSGTEIPRRMDTLFRHRSSTYNVFECRAQRR